MLSYVSNFFIRLGCLYVRIKNNKQTRKKHVKDAPVIILGYELIVGTRIYILRGDCEKVSIWFTNK